MAASSIELSIELPSLLLICVVVSVSSYLQGYAIQLISPNLHSFFVVHSFSISPQSNQARGIQTRKRHFQRELEPKLFAKYW